MLSTSLSSNSTRFHYRFLIIKVGCHVRGGLFVWLSGHRFIIITRYKTSSRQLFWHCHGGQSTTVSERSRSNREQRVSGFSEAHKGRLSRSRGTVCLVEWTQVYISISRIVACFDVKTGTHTPG